MESGLKVHNKLAFTQGQLFIVAFYNFINFICYQFVRTKSSQEDRGCHSTHSAVCKEAWGACLRRKASHTTRGLWPKKLTSFQIVTGGSSLKMHIFA